MCFINRMEMTRVPVFRPARTTRSCAVGHTSTRAISARWCGNRYGSRYADACIGPFGKMDSYDDLTYFPTLPVHIEFDSTSAGGYRCDRDQQEVFQAPALVKRYDRFSIGCLEGRQEMLWRSKSPSKDAAVEPRSSFCIACMRARRHAGLERQPGSVAEQLRLGCPEAGEANHMRRKWFQIFCIHTPNGCYV
jgi:hypothetical protein